MDGLMKGIIKTGVIFSAVLVAALFVFYIIPAFAAGATLTIAAPTPANNSNVSTVGAQGYFYVNISLTNNSVSSPNLEVYNLSVAGSLFMNFTMTNSTGNNIFNYTFFNVTGLSNGTFTWRVVGINVSEGLGANQTFGNFTVTLGQIYKAVITNPASGTTTNDVTPELRVSANSTFLTNLSLTFYTTKAGVTQAIINTTILNGTETAFNLTTLSNGTYTITAELGNSADFKVNSTAITLTVRHLEASASVNVASVNAGAKQNYTFTITNNGTDDNTDSIDMVNISYSAAGYADPAAGDIVCPTTTNLWNRSVDPVVNSIVCLLPGPGDDKITAGVSKTIKVENWSATNTGGLKLFSTSVRGAIGAGTKTVADSASTSVYGNLSLTGTSRVAATKEIGSTNVTIISFNLSATGEQMNISSITVARTGTATDADIVSVALYNSTQENAQTFNETLNIDPLAVNTSAPTAGAYTFSGLSLVVPSSQILIVVFNVSSTATGGGVFGAGIVAASSVTTTGGASGQSITETLATHVSGNSTIYGTLAVAGTNRASATTIIGTNNVTLMSLNFSATGEAMSVSEIVLMLNGTSISSADIQSVSLYNSTLVDTTTYNGTQTRLATNTTVTETPTSLTYNFSGLGLSVAAGSTKQTILVVVNVSSSATAGHTINATILNNANIVTTSAASGQSIAETLATGSSSSTIVVGTLAVTGISQVASTTQIGTKNITVIKFNFTAAGEAMNITSLNITFNGTHTTADIDRVGLYNGTPGSGYDLIQWNISEPVNGRYNFTLLGFNVSAGTTNVLLVVINLTDTAIGGHTFNVSIEGAADVVTVGGGSAQAITETFTTQRSSSSTIYGNLSVTGTNIAPTAADVGQIGVGLLRLTLNSTGEMINVTTFNVTSNSTSNTDVLAVKLYSDSGGATAGTYERGNDLPIAGASGVFTGSTVILTPTAPIQVENNTLSYVYVVVDVNTSAAIGLNRLGVSIQGASAITAVGNNSNVTLTPQLITGDPGGKASIRNLTATASVIGTTAAVGTLNNFTFTVNNTGVGTPTDSIDEIRILFGGTGFTLAGNATCPTISAISWNRTVLGANTVVCNVTDSGGRLPIDKNTTISLENFTAGATAGPQPFNVSVRGTMGGMFNITASRPTITVYGSLTVTGTTRVGATTQIGTNNVTLISYNLTAAGEVMTVSEIVLQLNGTGISEADIQSVTLYNSTDPSTATFNGSQTRLKVNSSAPTALSGLEYNLSGFSLSVPAGPTGQTILVVINVSSGATGGHTINGTIMSNANIVTVGGASSQNIAETLVTQLSDTSTIFGTLAVTGISQVASTTQIGTKNITVIKFNFTAAGEAMNITSLNITFNGTHTTADIDRVGLYNGTPGSGYDLIQWNISEPVNGRYNFTLLGFNVSVGTNVLLVVINVSSTATGGNTFNVSIEGAADVVTVSAASGQAITETFASQRSGTSTIYGNLTISGTSRVAGQTRLGSSNVTIISFNLTAFGEQMNISEIIVTRNGTVTDEDVVSVALYNSTKNNAQTFNETGNIDSLAINASAPTNGRYNFSGLSLKVPTGNIGQIIMVVFNVSSSANAGRTLNASVEGAADVATTSSASGVAITEDFASQRSVTSTIVGMKITGTSRVSSITEIGATNVSVISFAFNASGEDMNITGLNITFNGTITTADIVDVRLFNSTLPNAGVYNETTYDLVQRNLSEPNVSVGVNTLRFNFSNIGFNVTAGTINTLVVVVNMSGSATGGRTFNASIEGDADAIVTGVSSGLAITETYATQRSSTSTILGTLAVTGTNRVASYTRLGTNNVTVISFNFSTSGEQMNVTGINVTFNGTHTTADIDRVGLFNSTLPNAGVYNGTPSYDLIAWNNSPPVNGRYNFSNIGFNISSGGSNTLLVVVNISSTATGGNTFNVSIEGAGDVVTTGGTSGTSVTETFATQRSSSSTLVALNVSSSSLAPNTISANQTATAMLNITVVATGETMNITSFNFTLTGNATEGNVSDVRLYRDSDTAPGRFDTSDTFIVRGAGTSIQLNLTAYNISGSATFFVTYNISGVARTLATAGIQLTPSGIAAIGNASGLAIAVTGNSVASTNSTIQSEANLIFGAVTSSYPWITNKTATLNTTNISIPVTNGGASTANLTSVLITFLDEANANNASTNFTIVRADTVTSIAGGVTTALNFTVNATTWAQLLGRVNASVMIRYNDSNSYAAATTGPVETNTSGLFGVDGTLPTISIVYPANSGNASGNLVDINFTLNDAGSGVNRSAIAISINNVARNATCSPSGLNFTCNFTLFSSDSLFVFGSVTARIVNVTDNATNSASAAEINFTLNNNDGVANLTRPIVGADPYALGWNTIQMPTQTMMEQQGRNASNTGDFNFTSIMATLGTSWTHMYYNTNGSSTGWVLATRTDFAGSTLKYLNNTNANPYWVNMTSRGMVFKI